MESEPSASSKALLVGLQLPSVTSEDFEASLAELKRLVTTLGFQVVGSVSQKRSSPVSATVLGEGKIEELASLVKGEGGAAHGSHADLSPEKAKGARLIFDLELTPTQIRNIESATGTPVLDRTGVIVEIFYRHAKTREARAQVEIARLKYLAPRIQVKGGGERQGGGIGARGIGETAHELDKRRIRDRIAELQRELEEIRTKQVGRRSRRGDQPRVALVGYTNAGKSSLMRALTDSDVMVADKLFATLDTTVRAMQPEGYPRLLISDTVGFIRKLPHDLVASFRSTLDEALEASLLLYVVDGADPMHEQHLEVTRTVLREIGAAEIPSWVIVNKVDLLDDERREALRRQFPDGILLSTKDPAHVDALKRRLLEHFAKDMQSAELLVSYERKGVVGEIRRHALVDEERYEENGIFFRVRAYPDSLAKLRELMKP